MLLLKGAKKLKMSKLRDNGQTLISLQSRTILTRTTNQVGGSENISP